MEISGPARWPPAICALVPTPVYSPLLKRSKSNPTRCHGRSVWSTEYGSSGSTPLPVTLWRRCLLGLGPFHSRVPLFGGSQPPGHERPYGEVRAEGDAALPPASCQQRTRSANTLAGALPGEGPPAPHSSARATQQSCSLVPDPQDPGLQSMLFIIVINSHNKCSFIITWQSAQHHHSS